MEQNPGPQDNWNYNKSLRGFARKNRSDMTKAEACIWKYLLSNKQLMGYRFLRQRPIGPYIVDFFCKELRLIIEIDGITHQFEENQEKEEIRSKALKNMGFFIVRFSDDEVLKDMDNVERTLITHIGDIGRQSPYSTDSR